MQNNPQFSRSQLRKAYQKQYMYLYRHDKHWLFNTLPPQQKRRNDVKTVDWNRRDKEYSMRIKEIYEQLRASEKPIRITSSILGKRVGILANLEKHLEKLPITKNLLTQITESVQEFQIRRCYKVIDEMKREEVEIKLWHVQRLAGVKSKDFKKIQPILVRYIEKELGGIDERQRYKT